MDEAGQASAAGSRAVTAGREEARAQGHGGEEHKESDHAPSTRTELEQWASNAIKACRERLARHGVQFDQPLAVETALDATWGVVQYETEEDLPWLSAVLQQASAVLDELELDDLDFTVPSYEELLGE